MHNGNCYPNGSYFHDDRIKQDNLMCVLPNSTLNGGEWVTSNGSSVNCNINPLHCNAMLSPANISLYIPTGQNILPSDDGWYKCCLPTSCSDPSTNIITANIFSKYCSYRCVIAHCFIFIIGWTQIEDITVDLPSDITVLPQNFTLHAIKIGAFNRYYLKSANWYYESVNTSIGLCNGYKYDYNCLVGNGKAVNYGNGKIDYTVAITWSKENITNNGMLQGNGDLLYRFYLNFGVTRNRSQIVTGN